jgi:hypothetical protein
MSAHMLILSKAKGSFGVILALLSNINIDSAIDA